MFVVFDLDGTLADDTHRQHFLEREPKDWDAYFEKCIDDAPILAAVEIARALRSSAYPYHHIAIWTGRPETCRADTLDWLAERGIWIDELRMRATGDCRPDIIVKGEWLGECGGNRPDLVLDDRTKSVAWWRSQGITCYQVAEHDY